MVILGSGSSGALYAINSKPGSYKSFVLSASGTAYYTYNGQTVSILLSISGTTVSGSPQSKVANLQVQEGTANIGSSLQFSVSTGSGYVGQVNQDSKLNFKVSNPNQQSGPYSYGKSETWNLDGLTISLSGNVATITLTANTENLPIINNPTITNISMIGTVTLT